MEITKAELYKLYWENNMSPASIAKYYGLPKRSTIRSKMKSFGIPFRSPSLAAKFKNNEARRLGKVVNCAYCDRPIYRKPSRLKNYPRSVCSMRCLGKLNWLEHKKFQEQAFARNPVDLSLHSNLGYIIGVILGDGHIERRTIELRVKHRKFAQSFAMSIEALGLRYSIVPTIDNRPNHSVLYRVRAHSQTFVEWWFELSKESLRFIVMAYPKAFLKGFYESEGNYRKDGQSINLSNTDKDKLLLASTALSILGFHPYLYGPYSRKLPQHKPLYSLRLNRQEEVRQFFDLIKPVVKTRDG